MAANSSVSAFSPTAASRQSVLSFHKRLGGGRRSMQALPARPPISPLGPLGPLGAVGGVALRGGLRGGLGRRHAQRLLVDGADVTPRPLLDVAFADERPPVTVSTPQAPHPEGSRRCRHPSSPVSSLTDTVYGGA